MKEIYDGPLACTDVDEQGNQHLAIEEDMYRAHIDSYKKNKIDD